MAKMIVGYGKGVGGFVGLEELEEIGDVDRCLNKWFVVEGSGFGKIGVNKDGLDKLGNDGYMEFYKGKGILEYGGKRGNIKGVWGVCVFEEFREKEVEGLCGYLYFE